MFVLPSQLLQSSFSFLLSSLTFFPFILFPLPFFSPHPTSLYSDHNPYSSNVLYSWFFFFIYHWIVPFTTLFGTRICDLLSDFLCVLHQNAPNIQPCCNFSHLSYRLNIAMSVHLFRCFSKFPTHCDSGHIHPTQIAFYVRFCETQYQMST